MPSSSQRVQDPLDAVPAKPSSRSRRPSSNSSNSQPLQDISNSLPVHPASPPPTSFAKAAESGAWGAHVLRPGKADAPVAPPSVTAKLGERMAGKFSRSHSATTRTSLKRKGGGKRKRPSFDTFNTLTGGDGDGEGAAKPKFVDPMARFDPELSMDGVEGGDDKGEDTEEVSPAPRKSFSFFDEVSSCGISKMTSSVNPKLKESRPVNFLTFGSSFSSSALKPTSAKLPTTRSVDQGWLDRCVGKGDQPDIGKAEDVNSKSKLSTEAEPSDTIPPTSEEPVKEPSPPKEAKEKVTEVQLNASLPEVPVPQSTVARKDSCKDDSDVEFIVSEGEEESLLDLARPKKKLKKSPSEPNTSDIYALGFEEAEEASFSKSISLPKGIKRSFSKEERLKHKLKTDNFVKINLKKKTYVKGKKTMTGAKYRRMEFKRKMAEKEGKGGGSKKRNCFSCGEDGHWANQCPGKSDKLMPELNDAEGDDGGEFPTLEEAADMARGCSFSSAVPSERANVYESQERVSEDKDIFDDDEDAFLLKACSEWQPGDVATESFDLLNKVPPYFSQDESDEECLKKMNTTLINLFKFEKFRPGQAEAALRILRGQSSLVLLSTGAGKSLIYQLPAYLYKQRGECITIVVSPLVSLMEDQVVGLPSGLKAACLHSNLNDTQKGKVVDQIKSRKLHFLLVSPEALAGGGAGGGFFASLLRDLPPIAFVCIDEAHCVSQWSHNFRPAYLRLCRVIRERLGVQTILGLTATAPESTIRNVAEHLSVDAEFGIIRGELMPKNLVLSVSKDEDRDQALIKLLQGDRFASCDSVIIYCTRRDVCERLAVLIRTSMQDEDLKKKEAGAAGTKGSRRKGLSLTAEPYHAGLTAFRRKSVQTKFMSGQLRIVVATVAFGMGIDKSDIRAVIHYNMPKTFESYIQEIGRAGRDGKEAHCHLFLSGNTSLDLQELRRHIHANSVDEQTIRKLLDYVFPEENDVFKKDETSTYREIAVSVEEIVENLDLPEENISTLLCYLENHSDRRWLKLLNPVYSHCKVRCYNGPRQLKAVSKRSPPLAAALALARKAGKLSDEKTAQFDFPVVSVAAKMGWDSGVVKRELKNLQWTRAANGAWRKSGVLVEFSELAFHFEAVRALTEEERDGLKNYLHGRVTKREKTELYDLQRVFRSFNAVACRSFRDCCGSADEDLSNKLKSFVAAYFSEEVKSFEEISRKTVSLSEAEEARVKGDVRQFVLSHSDHKWHGRAVARVFHGIGSPCFPAQQWGRVHRYWRAHLDVDFDLLCALARRAILDLRGMR